MKMPVVRDYDERKKGKKKKKGALPYVSFTEVF